MISRRDNPGLPVFLSIVGRTDTDDRYSSREVSRADNAEDRARACEKEYRARSVSFGRTISGKESGNRDGSSGGGLLPSIMRSP